MVIINSIYQVFLFNANNFYTAIGIMFQVFANSPGDRGSIPGQVIPKTQKMVLDASLLSTQHMDQG